MVPERRDPIRRAAFVQTIVTELVQSPTVQFTIPEVERLLDTTPEIAQRVLLRLAAAGVVQQSGRAAWIKVTPQPQFSSRSL
jgi:hypothetical protein